MSPAWLNFCPCDVGLVRPPAAGRSMARARCLHQRSGPIAEEMVDESALLDLLEAQRTGHPEGFTEEELVQFVPEMPVAELRAVLGRLVHAGEVQYVGDGAGRYRIALPEAPATEGHGGGSERAGSPTTIIYSSERGPAAGPAARVPGSIPAVPEGSLRSALGALLRSWWNVFFHPSVATFDRERPGAEYRKIWLGVLLFTATSAVLAFLSELIGFLLAYAIAFALTNWGGAGGPSPSLGDALVGSLSGAVGDPAPVVRSIVEGLAGLWVVSGALWLSARYYGGSGGFREQTYLLSLAGVPVALAAAVLAAIPFLGALIGLALDLYLLALVTFALQSAHAVPTGRAVRIWLTPVVVLFLLSCVLLFLVAAQVIPPFEFSL